MRRIFSALGLIYIVAELFFTPATGVIQSHAQAADDVFPSMNVHVTNIGGGDDTFPTAYAHVTNIGPFNSVVPSGGVNCSANCGTVDDTPALQKALNTGRPLQLTGGTYNVCGLLLPTKATIVGVSSGTQGGGSFFLAPTNCAALFVPKAATGTTVGAAGSGYQINDTITLQTTAQVTGSVGPTVVKVSQLGVAVLPTVSAGGNSGTNGACVITGTTGTGTKATYNATIGGNALTAVGSIATAGIYTVAPSNPDPVTGCSLVAASIAIPTSSFGVVAAPLSTPGAYSANPSSPIAQTATSGSGTAATMNVTYQSTMVALADPTAAVDINLQNFTMNGNATNQSQALDLLHIDNHGASTSNIPNDRLLNMNFRQAAGSCLILDFQTRDTFATNLGFYKCGQFANDPAVVLAGADSVFTNWDVGASFGHGVQVTSSGGAAQLSNAKIWGSGNNGTANFNNLICNSCVSWHFNNIQSQDAGGNGILINTGTNITFSGNDDSSGGQAASTYAGISMAAMTNSIVDMVCNNRSGGAGVEKNCISFQSTANTGNNIRFQTTGQSSFAMGGNGNNNYIQQTGAATISAPAYASTLTPSPIISMVQGAYLYEPAVLTGNLILAAPSAGGGNTYPSGMQFCVRLKQDSSGGHTIDFTAYKGTGAVTTTLNTWTFACFVYDGTNWNTTAFTTGVI